MELLCEAIRIREQQEEIDLQLQENYEILKGYKECGKFVSSPNLNQDAIDIINRNYQSLERLMVIIGNKILEIELEIEELQNIREVIAYPSFRKRKFSS